MSFSRVCRVGVWFSFVGSALLLAVGTCVVLSFEAMPGLCYFLRVIHVLHVRGLSYSEWLLKLAGRSLVHKVYLNRMFHTYTVLCTCHRTCQDRTSAHYCRLRY